MGKEKYKMQYNCGMITMERYHELISEVEMPDISNVYSEFDDFLYSEYGSEPVKNEVAEAIINWSANYMIDQDSNGDFPGVKRHMDAEVENLLKGRVSSNFMNGMNAYGDSLTRNG